MSERKRGRLGKDEEKFIRDNFPSLSIPEIADQLNRSQEPVEKFIRLKVRPDTAPNAPVFQGEHPADIEIRQELRSSQKWVQLKKELTVDEIKFFEEEYLGMMRQFEGNVLHTEEAQIFDAIKLELLKARNMVARKKAAEEVGRLERLMTDLVTKHPDVTSMSKDEKELMFALENQLNVARAKEQDKTNEWTKLQERVEKIRVALKSNRDQRIKEIESSKINFLGIVKMLQQKDIQEMEARQNELLKLAANKSYADLGKPHKYEDNNEDSPILSADTVGSEQESTADDDAV